MQDLKYADHEDDIYQIANSTASEILDDKVFDPEQAGEWAKTISSTIINKLQSEQKGFKYICEVSIFQKGIGTLYLSGQCLWNPNTDGNCKIQYENDSLNCFISLFSVAP